MKNRYFEINQEGHNIRCKLYFNDIPSIKKIVIFGHGFGGHKDNKAAERFAERVLSKYKGIAVITFNMPCHGDDVKKKMSLTACYDYLRLVIEYAKNGYGAQELYYYATSFGGYMGLSYIHKNGNPFRKILLRSPAVNMYDSLTQTIMKNEDHEKMEKGKDVPVGFDRKIMIGKSFLEELKEEDIRRMDFLDFADDILIMHGTKDEVIPFAEAEKFAEDNVIEFIPVEGADHRFQKQAHMELCIKTIIEFFGF